MGSVVVVCGLQGLGSVAVVHGLTCSMACGILLDQGSNPCCLHWQVDSYPLYHLGSPVWRVLTQNKRRKNELKYQIMGIDWIGAQLVKRIHLKSKRPQFDPVSGSYPGEGHGNPLQYFWASLVAQMVKNLPAMRRPGLERSPGGRRGNPLQYSCLENPHGQRNLAGYTPWSTKELDTTEQLSTAQHIHWRISVTTHIKLYDQETTDLVLIGNNLLRLLMVQDELERREAREGVREQILAPGDWDFNSSRGNSI